METHARPSDLGAVISVRGRVVDIDFDAHLPAVCSLLRAKKGKIATGERESAPLLLGTPAVLARRIAACALSVLL